MNYLPQLSKWSNLATDPLKFTYSLSQESLLKSMNMMKKISGSKVLGSYVKPLKGYIPYWGKSGKVEKGKGGKARCYPFDGRCLKYMRLRDLYAYKVTLAKYNLNYVKEEEIVFFKKSNKGKEKEIKVAGYNDGYQHPAVLRAFPIKDIKDLVQRAYEGVLNREYSYEKPVGGVDELKGMVRLIQMYSNVYYQLHINETFKQTVGLFLGRYCGERKIYGEKGVPKKETASTLADVLKALMVFGGKKSLQEVKDEGLKCAVGEYIDATNDPTRQRLKIKPSLDGINQLLRIGAEGESLKGEGELLLRAVESELYEIVKFLLESGVDANVKDEEGFSLLNDLIMKGSYKYVKLLLEYGADPNYRQPNGSTSLLSALNISRELARLLINSKNVDVNLPGKFGTTPLIRAIQIGSYEVAKLLLEKGAKIELKDEEGRTAKEVAKMFNNFQMINLLKYPPKVRSGWE